MHDDRQISAPLKQIDTRYRLQGSSFTGRKGRVGWRMGDEFGYHSELKKFLTLTPCGATQSQGEENPALRKTLGVFKQICRRTFCPV